MIKIRKECRLTVRSEFQCENISKNQAAETSSAGNENSQKTAQTAPARVVKVKKNTQELSN